MYYLLHLGFVLHIFPGHTYALGIVAHCLAYCLELYLFFLGLYDFPLHAVSWISDSKLPLFVNNYVYPCFRPSVQRIVSISSSTLIKIKPIMNMNDWILLHRHHILKHTTALYYTVLYCIIPKKVKDLIKWLEKMTPFFRCKDYGSVDNISLSQFELDITLKSGVFLGFFCRWRLFLSLWTPSSLFLFACFVAPCINIPFKLSIKSEKKVSRLQAMLVICCHSWWGSNLLQ